MSEFSDLESLYKHLEDKALDLKHPQLVGVLFQKLRDLKHKEEKHDEVEKAQWELDFFNFIPKSGQIHPAYPRNQEGLGLGYPNFDIFDERTYQYLETRLSSTNNPLLKAQYAHILWCSPKKHRRYAEIAVDSYLQLTKVYEERDRQSPDQHFGLYVFNAAENACKIAVNIRYKVDVIRREFRRLITEFDLNSDCSFRHRANLITVMLEEKRNFPSEDFKDFPNICWQISQALTQEGNVSGAIDMLKLGEKVDRRLQQKTRDWTKSTAESHEMIMNRNLKANKPVALEHCLLAIRDYKTIKCEEKIKELENKYAEVKGSLEFGVFRTEIDLTEHIKSCKDFAKRMVQNPPEEIIRFLMHDKDLLPRYKDVERTAQEYAKKFILQHLATTEIIDQRGHPVQHFSDEEEKKRYGILQQYEWELQLDKITLINEIFSAAIREKKLSSDTVLPFLSKHSWLGKSIPKLFPNEQRVEYNWLDLIAPGLRHYFREMQRYLLEDSTSRPNLVLCTDSLALKIEGLLRDICELSDIRTSSITQRPKGKITSREKDIQGLLHEQGVKKLLSEDDLLFLQFLMVEQAGYNLRHKIAHSLLLFQQYTIESAHLIVLALFRLGKYDFVKKENTASDNSA